MTLKHFVRLIWSNKYWLVFVPVLVASGVYLFSSNLPRKYETSAVIFTNPISNKGATEGGVVRMDFYTSNNLFDNLTLLVKSRETVKNTALKLLSQHLLLSGPDERIISERNYTELDDHLSPQLREALVVNEDKEATFRNLERHLKEHKDSPIDYLLREHPHYSVPKIIDALYVARKASSDMMEITFRSEDPGICYHTLNFLTETFMERYAGMKELENINSINYFEDQLIIAQEKLRRAENELKAFIADNKILNFYEQGKYLDIAKLEQDQDEEKARRLIAGTKTNLEDIEAMFDGFDRRQSIIGKISDLQSRIVSKNLEIQGLNMQAAREKNISSLEHEIDLLKREIDSASQDLFKNNTSLQGIQRQTVLDEWLKLKISYEEQIQALDVMQDRKQYLDSKIQEFAPLGAELKTLEREVEVNENQYLSILHGLNMAYLQKYDLEMSSPQKLVDIPFYPKTPLPSKRKLLTIGSLFSSGIFVLALVLGWSLIDRTIKSKEKAEKLTGLKVAGGWINEKKIQKNVLRSSLFNKLIKQFYNNINKFLPQNGKTNIMFYSIQRGEGKTFLIKKLAEEFQHQHRDTLYFGPKEKDENMPCEARNYTLTDHLCDQNESYWEQTLSGINKDMLLWELPHIEEAPMNFRLINRADILVLVLDSGRKWNSSDENLLNGLLDTVKIPHVIWLNNMEEGELEDLNGEIPKKRSWLRTKIKGIVS
ncbi:GumC family protein [Negadavirga shengliensis]|uniref:GumC family protein n=1 Tax=Negadavirga shengliensis TaxID=1389218 RepID=A0ABV9T3S0_9BACT